MTPQDRDDFESVEQWLAETEPPNTRRAKREPPLSTPAERMKVVREHVTPAQRTTFARLAAHERWARVSDRAAATAAGRQAAADRFLRMAAELHPGADDELIAKAADNLRSAHMIRAARARWGKHRAP